MNMHGATFPGGSKSRVSRAGDAVRNRAASPDDLEVIDVWREAHRHVLNTFQAILRTRTRGSDVVVAQRHKRKSTIFGKLHRYKSMELSRMDDVAGCRLIFPSIAELYSFRATIHEAKFRHKMRNESDKWDYIKHPKETGYRGVHDVYEYDVNSQNGRAYKGLLIELQYRTRVQHAWSTCVEVIGHVTQSQPKFQRGDKRYETILAYASELLARVEEDKRSCFPDLPDVEVVRKFRDLDHELGFMALLRNLNAANNEISSKKNVILIFSEAETLEIRSFRDATDALSALFVLEKQNPDKDIVLVRADTSEDVRIAFKNYFSDARDFIVFIDKACEQLSQVRLV